MVTLVHQDGSIERMNNEKSIGLPPFVRILGVNYAVREVPVVDKMEPLKGSIDYLNSKILIDKDMRTDLKYQVLIHEVLHAILDAVGQYEIGGNETAVQSIATAIHSVIKENKDCIQSSLEKI